MTTKAGLAGILTGLTATLILFYPLAMDSSTSWIWIAVVAVAVMTIGGGSLAGTWGGSVRPERCATLGGLAGGLAGVIVFCLLGAAAAGQAASESLLRQVANDTMRQRAQMEAVVAIVNLTQKTFLVAFLGGIGLGSMGGWLASPRRNDQADIFDKSAPQMAMNVAITAVPAAVIVAALAAAVFLYLSDSIGSKTDQAVFARSILDLPIATSLLLVLVAHFALTLVIPHEAREAEHRCGMDEVKMAAYVGIGTAPVLAFLLLMVSARLFLNPLVIIALLASAVMSLKSLQILSKVILPGCASLPAPQDDRQRTEAKFFGTIADSYGPRLMALCFGCGLVMILPLHVTVLSVLINLTNLLTSPPFSAEVTRKLFLTQALVSAGLAATSIIVLSSIYLFYLNLGRWFKRKHSPLSRS